MRFQLAVISSLLGMAPVLAAPAPAKVTAPVLFEGFNGAALPGEYSASILGSDAAGHTTYAFQWSELQVQATRIGTSTPASYSVGPLETISGINTLVVGSNYISQLAYAAGTAGIAEGLGYQCTFTGSRANCVGYEPIVTGTYNPTLQSNLPTQAFSDIVLDVPGESQGNSALGRGSSMVGALVGLGFVVQLFGYAVHCRALTISFG
ncbi:hypothetical protein HMN09_01097300 [Mycena chlorophos]|uniref:Uncharacterized protein n=1 Tax=Mycena chlorophos TaxID=658473 RepID=A0A8H6SCM9_MYCCL|nr:hypothetical protein HMN09_01097300 [Mycena chlorophos]